MKFRALILGYGEMGHALECLLMQKHKVHIWSRSASSNLADEVAQAQIILFCLPVSAHNEMLKRIAPWLQNGSLCLSIAKGLDESGNTAAQIIHKELGNQHHYGVMYGPMISEEIRQARYAFADVALSSEDDFARKGL